MEETGGGRKKEKSRSEREKREKREKSERGEIEEWIEKKEIGRRFSLVVEHLSCKQKVKGSIPLVAFYKF